VLIEQFDPRANERSLRSCFEIVVAAQQHDDPAMPARSMSSFAAWWGYGYDGSPRQTWLATVDGEPVGCYLLTLPDRENLTLARCVLTVTPTARRAGIGAQLLQHCADQARRDGRTRLASAARQDSAGAAFAASAGAVSGMTDMYRALFVDAARRAAMAALRADAQLRTVGYTLVSWLGATPDEHMEGVVRLSNAMADAPRDADTEPEIWDADRIRAQERVDSEHGWQSYTLAARHDATGDLVAITQVATSPDVPGWGFQQLTAVLGEHRGHRLGMLIKTAMMDLLEAHEPGVRHLLTSNSGPNAHMIAINELLGFEVISVHQSWELDLTAG